MENIPNLDTYMLFNHFNSVSTLNIDKKIFRRETDRMDCGDTYISSQLPFLYLIICLNVYCFFHLSKRH